MNVIDASEKFKQRKIDSSPSILEQDIQKAYECISTLEQGFLSGEPLVVESEGEIKNITPTNLLTALFCDEVIILNGFETLSLAQKVVLADYITGIAQKELEGEADEV